MALGCLSTFPLLRAIMFRYFLTTFLCSIINRSIIMSSSLASGVTIMPPPAVTMFWVEMKSATISLSMLGVFTWYLRGLDLWMDASMVLL